jgi:SAM-dependent methyltransferase
MSNAKDYYNLNSQGYVQKWDQLFGNSDSPKDYFRRQLIDLVLGMSHIRKNSKVVEVGCGTGLVLKEVLKHTDRVFGIDIAEAMLRRVADSTLRDKKVAIVNDFSDADAYGAAEIVLMEGDFRALNLPRGYFDRIISVEVLRYVDDIEKCFDYCRSIMKSDSIFIFTITNLWSASLFPVKYTVRKLAGLIDDQKELKQYFVTERRLREKLRKTGLELVDSKRFGLLALNPLLRRLIQTKSAAVKIHDLDTKMANLRGVRNLFDTLIVAVKKG